jgi:hypothetical protein
LPVPLKGPQNACHLFGLLSHKAHFASGDRSPKPVGRRARNCDRTQWRRFAIHPVCSASSLDARS